MEGRWDITAMSGTAVGNIRRPQGSQKVIGESDCYLGDALGSAGPLTFEWPSGEPRHPAQDPGWL